VLRAEGWGFGEGCGKWLEDDEEWFDWLRWLDWFKGFVDGNVEGEFGGKVEGELGNVGLGLNWDCGEFMLLP
jgi:hypothetical protein